MVVMVVMVIVMAVMVAVMVVMVVVMHHTECRTLEWPIRHQFAQFCY
jgi:hypothetical protein